MHFFDGLKYKYIEIHTYIPRSTLHVKDVTSHYNTNGHSTGEFPLSMMC